MKSPPMRPTVLRRAVEWGLLVCLLARGVPNFDTMHVIEWEKGVGCRDGAVRLVRINYFSGYVANARARARGP